MTTWPPPSTTAPPPPTTRLPAGQTAATRLEAVELVPLELVTRVSPETAWAGAAARLWPATSPARTIPPASSRPVRVLFRTIALPSVAWVLDLLFAPTAARDGCRVVTCGRGPADSVATLRGAD